MCMHCEYSMRLSADWLRAGAVAAAAQAHGGGT